MQLGRATAPIWRASGRIHDSGTTLSVRRGDTTVEVVAIHSQEVNGRWVINVRCLQAWAASGGPPRGVGGP
eukprot:3241769-Amphidinium_carterae.1